jgi:hypothetical protein
MLLAGIQKKAWMPAFAGMTGGSSGTHLCGAVLSDLGADVQAKIVHIKRIEEAVAKRAFSPQTSFPRRRESRFFNDFWTPTFVGVTGFGGLATASEE